MTNDKTPAQEALEWVVDAMKDIEDSRVKLKKSLPVLDRAEKCLNTIRAALTQIAALREDYVMVPREKLLNKADWTKEIMIGARDKMNKAIQEIIELEYLVIAAAQTTEKTND